ncbi:MAG TPA: helix-turn-helix transcriptional regulator [Solirubrobacteraceae bacterium]|jgi:transcriptional regulator with XRE-family HTH domain|nr:helix-turn-helix transcriptional regulator [Solirubrobacteraceae bacterium]
MAEPPQETIGARVKRFREDAGLSATELAGKAGVSKSYLSALESGDTHSRRPSGETMYSLAKELGVAMSDLLGRPVLHKARSKRPPSLIAFATENAIPESDVEMLASIRFRGEQPQTAKRWEFIYEAIKNSRGMDGRR